MTWGREHLRWAGKHTGDHTITVSFAQKMFTITASAGSNGSISPAGSITIGWGSDQPYEISPDAGYQIEDVLVDGFSVGAVGSYTFLGINADHTITAGFVQDTTYTSAFFENGTQKASSFVIYPNPTTGSLHIRGIDATVLVRVCDLVGREWIITEVSNSSVLDVSVLKPGMYIIEINEDHNCVLKRFIKN